MKQVYTLDDLASRELLDAGFEKPARLAVIGFPIAHSASPGMHQSALDMLGIHARYIRIEVQPGELVQTFARMRALGFIGTNVTVPHKLEAMTACDHIHPEAQALGAVNTIHFDHNGMIHGFNTDGPGFIRSIKDSFGLDLITQRVAILGAGGGAGQAIATMCAMCQVPHLMVVNRSIDKLKVLLPKLQKYAPHTKIIASSFDDPELPKLLSRCDLLVNATSVGLQQNDPSVISATCLNEHQAVYDTIYQPEVTPLLALAKQIGCRIANGRSMLLHQGVIAFQQWFPTSNPESIMRNALMPTRATN